MGPQCECPHDEILIVKELLLGRVEQEQDDQSVDQQWGQVVDVVDGPEDGNGQDQ